MARNPHIITNDTPRISANELAKYMLASETGKLGVIRNAIRSTTAARVRYKPARDCIKAFLSSEHKNVADIHAKIATLQAIVDDQAASAFAKEDSQYSIDALNSFLGLRNQLGPYTYTVVPARGQPHLNLHGVDVSVNLDLTAERTYKGKKQIGGVILRLSKSGSGTPAAVAKREDMGRYVATLAHIRAAQNSENAYRGMSCSIDAQFGQALYCPPAFTQRVQNLENACRFIAGMWDGIKDEIDNG